jgi:hypothetical protein
LQKRLNAGRVILEYLYDYQGYNDFIFTSNEFALSATDLSKKKKFNEYQGFNEFANDFHSHMKFDASNEFQCLQ